jgi:ATP-dependent DNA ligase
MRKLQAALPVVLPMLSTSAKPFDDPGCVFDVKWDGVRALASVEGKRWRLWGRETTDYTDR